MYITCSNKKKKISIAILSVLGVFEFKQCIFKKVINFLSQYSLKSDLALIKKNILLKEF